MKTTKENKLEQRIERIIRIAKARGITVSRSTWMGAFKEWPSWVARVDPDGPSAFAVYGSPYPNNQCGAMIEAIRECEKKKSK